MFSRSSANCIIEMKLRGNEMSKQFLQNYYKCLTLISDCFVDSVQFDTKE